MPNKYHYQFTKVAASDIGETLEYISDSLSSPLSAEQLYGKIEKAIEQICSFPYAFADCSCFLIADKNVRHVPVRNYVIIYEVSEEEAMVRILRFLYSKMDLPNVVIQ